MVNFTTVTTALYASVTDTVLSLCANHYATSSAKLRYFQVSELYFCFESARTLRSVRTIMYLRNY